MIYQVKLRRRLVRERSDVALHQEQGPGEGPSGNPVSIENREQARIVLVCAFVPRARTIAAFELILKARAFSFVQSQHAQAKTVVAGMTPDGVIHVASVVKESVAILRARSPGGEVGACWLQKVLF